MTLAIKIMISVISLWVFLRVWSLYRQERQTSANSANRIPLILTGFVANVFDTLGVGSFAIIIAINKKFRFVSDKMLPGTLNAQGILPAMLQALIFLQLVEMDFLTLVVLVVGASIGGYAGGATVTRFNQQNIRIAMTISYTGMAVLLLSGIMGWLPLGGQATGLHGVQLLLGFLAMLVVGSLPAVGVGLYAPTQLILFLLGMSPLVAFPVMTTAGAIQQPLTALAFVQKRQLGLRETMLLAVSGVLAVALVAPLVTMVNPSILRYFLLGLVLYNAGSCWMAYQQNSRELSDSAERGKTTPSIS